jgi:dolichol-phosphate mannosyltransferase
VVFFDNDSPEYTAADVRRLGQIMAECGRFHGSDFATSAPCVAVMDADLQHDEKILSAMLDALRPVIVDINVGSRYVAGGDVGEWAGIDQSARDTGALGRRAARPE